MLPRVGIVGCGLIGGSLARALAEAGVTVAAWDPDPAFAVALADPAVRIGTSLDDVADDVDVVVVCAPPSVTPDLVAEVLRRFPDVLVTDTASVKGAVISQVVERDPDGARERYIPGHPLAGREQMGAAAADPELFRGAVWALCPDPETPVDAVLFVARVIWAARASVLPIDAGSHDRAVAFSSHGPHLVASAVATAAAGAGPLTAILSGGGLRDATRVAASDGAMWWEIVSENAHETLAAIDAQRAALDALVDALLRDDEAAFRAVWEPARIATGALLAERGRARAWEPLSGGSPDTDDLLRLGAQGRLLRCGGSLHDWPPTIEVGAAPR